MPINLNKVPHGTDRHFLQGQLAYLLGRASHRDVMLLDEFNQFYNDLMELLNKLYDYNDYLTAERHGPEVANRALSYLGYSYKVQVTPAGWTGDIDGYRVEGFKDGHIMTVEEIEALAVECYISKLTPYLDNLCAKGIIGEVHLVTAIDRIADLGMFCIPNCHFVECMYTDFECINEFFDACLLPYHFTKVALPPIMAPASAANDKPRYRLMHTPF